MRVPKAKSRVVNSYRVSGPDGFKDVDVGSKTNKKPDDVNHSTDDFDDVKARQKKYGLYPF